MQRRPGGSRRHFKHTQRLVRQITDISLPIENAMWAYRPEWKNVITETESVLKGGKSTVYNLNLFSHTGTYIETCEHKIPVKRRLDTLSLHSFYGEAKVLKVTLSKRNSITLENFLTALDSARLEIHPGDKVIIFSGYGERYNEPDYISASPCFDKELTDYLISKKPTLLGVDSPVIEDTKNPYQPVGRLFEADKDMLLLAPLQLPSAFKSGVYILSCFPLPVKDISGCLCRAILIDEK